MGNFGVRISDFGLGGPELAHSGAANPKSEIRNPKSSSRLLTNRGKQDRFGRKLGTDPYLTFHFPDARLAADDLHDNPHLITRNDRPAKLGLIYSQEVDECFAEVSVLFKQPEYGTCLGHRLDRQNAGHDGGAWKMTVEERLIDADVLQRNDAFVRVDLNNTVHQEKRMPVRKNPHDLSNAQFHERISKFEFRISNLGRVVHPKSEIRNSKFAIYFFAGSAGFAAALPASASTRRMISVVMSATSWT